MTPGDSSKRHSYGKEEGEKGKEEEEGEEEQGEEKEGTAAGRADAAVTVTD